jgi:hypothetical protein
MRTSSSEFSVCPLQARKIAVPFTLTREQLYELVWSEPMRLLSKQIGISDVAIAKHCRKIGVPIPERGYWNKLQAGKNVTKAALPVRDLGTIDRVELSGTLDSVLRDRIKGEPGASDLIDESIDVLAERFRKRLGTVTIPRSFSRTHPLVDKLLQKDEARRQNYLTSPYSWNEPCFDAPFERRRLQFINGLFLGFEKVGGKGWIRGDTARELGVSMGNASVQFTLDRPDKGRGSRGSDQKHTRKEKLVLTISHPNPSPEIAVRWEDQDSLPIESQITDIIVGMASAGLDLHRHWTAQQRAWQRQRREEEERAAQKKREEAARRELARLAAAEKAKIDALCRDADNWRNAGNIRIYVAAVRQASGGIADHETLEKWSQWALNEAAKLDPITSGRYANQWKRDGAS